MAITTDVDICNLALSRCGGAQIGALDEESVEAEQCSIFYSNAVELALTESAWPFARATKTLALKVDAPEEWEYAYGYPNDCLTLLYLVPAGNSRANVKSVFGEDAVDQVPFDIGLDASGTQVIMTNAAEAKAAYIKQIDDVRLMTPRFKDMVAWLLCQDLAPILGGDSANFYLQRAESKYLQILGKAQAHAKNQRSTRLQQQLPKSLQARNQSLGRPYRRVE